MIPDILEEWLTNLLSADAALLALFPGRVEIGSFLVPEEDSDTEREDTGPIVTYAYVDGPHESNRCGGFVRGQYIITVKTVWPGRSFEVAKPMAKRVNDLIEGVTAEAGGRRFTISVDSSVHYPDPPGTPGGAVHSGANYLFDVR